MMKMETEDKISSSNRTMQWETCSRSSKCQMRTARLRWAGPLSRSRRYECSVRCWNKTIFLKLKCKSSQMSREVLILIMNASTVI
jgi:hypothetical protein